MRNLIHSRDDKRCFARCQSVTAQALVLPLSLASFGQMNRTTTYSAIGLSVVAVAAIIDAAFGFGAVEWLVDLRLTDGDQGMSDMVTTDRDVKPVPLIALGLGVSVAAIWFLTTERRRAANGTSPPDSEERAGILSAMLVVAVARGKTSRDEMLGTFQVVTGQRLEDVFVDLAMDRYEGMVDVDPRKIKIEPVSSAIGRRRALGAAMLMAHPMRTVPAMQSLIANMADKIGATEDDCRAVRASIEDWNEDCREITEVPLVSLLRHRRLTLRPA